MPFARLELNVEKMVRCETQQVSQQGLALVRRQHVDEVFALFEVTPEYGFKYTSIDELVARITETYSSQDPLVDVNLQSRLGDTILKTCVSNFHLAEEAPASQLRLVQFLLTKGADPNLEDSLGETSLGWLLDSYLMYNLPLTSHHCAMIQLLIDFGGKTPSHQF